MERSTSDLGLEALASDGGSGIVAAIGALGMGAVALGMVSEARRESLRQKSPFVTIYDDEAVKAAGAWYGGQGDPLYVIVSNRGIRIPEEDVEQAMYNIARDLASVKRLGPDRYQFGCGVFKKDDIDQLKGLHDTLMYALIDPDARYHGD